MLTNYVSNILLWFVDLLRASEIEYFGFYLKKCDHGQLQITVFITGREVDGEFGRESG